MTDDGPGVGPHPQPWPLGDQFDPELLAAGDHRNVADRYRYWSVEAIRADLDRRRHPFAVAIENWQHDLNIGTVVRAANAFNASSVHIVGRRRWNRRGAMVTDRYLHVAHHGDARRFATWAKADERAVIGIDNFPGAVALDHAPLPKRCVLVFGQEGPGLSAEMRDAVDEVRFIPQYGSTRSINAGVAAGIAMYEWIRTHAPDPLVVDAELD